MARAMDEFQLFAVHGAAALQFIPELARLRIEVFREFPYLYDGDLGYEEKYLQTYIQSPDSVIIVAKHNDVIIGASTAIPLKDETSACQQPFKVHGYDIEKIFYFGESVLRKPYRGRGIGVEFFKAREACAASLGLFDYYTFCAVERPNAHPRRPADYVPLDNFWRKRGYEKQKELYTSFDWKDLDDETSSEKKMVFWLKALAPG